MEYIYIYIISNISSKEASKQFAYFSSSTIGGQGCKIKDKSAELESRYEVIGENQEQMEISLVSTGGVGLIPSTLIGPIRRIIIRYYVLNIT